MRNEAALDPKLWILYLSACVCDARTESGSRCLRVALLIINYQLMETASIVLAVSSTSRLISRRVACAHATSTPACQAAIEGQLKANIHGN